MLCKEGIKEVGRVFSPWKRGLRREAPRGSLNPKTEEKVSYQLGVGRKRNELALLLGVAHTGEGEGAASGPPVLQALC